MQDYLTRLVGFGSMMRLGYMKTILRRYITYVFIIFLLPKVVPGFTSSESIVNLLVAALIFTLLMMIVKPILSVVTFPINLITLGLFSLFINAGILYLLTIFVNSVALEGFTYPATHILGFAVPKIAFNTFFAYVYTGFIVTVIDGLITWLVKTGE
jgi:putative membrane protein